MTYSVYVADTETTGLDHIKNDVVEISLLRVSDGEQKTWTLRPFDFNSIEPEALKVNGFTKEQLAKFDNPSKIIAEIENWVMEDGVLSTNRVLAGQNINFDKLMMESLWNKCKSKDSFPFGRRYLDTMQIEFFLDYCKSNFADSYSLSALTKKYGVKNEKAHSAAADVKATFSVLEKQLKRMQGLDF